MRTLMSLLALLVAVLASRPALPQSGGGNDIIKLKNGEKREGKIVDVTYIQVSYTPPGGGGGQLAEPIGNVAELLFTDQPYGIIRGDSLLMKENKPEEAIGQYQKGIETLDKKEARPFHKQYALFGIARSYQATGKWGEANTWYDKLLQEAPQTRFLFETYIGSYQCALNKGDTAKCETITKMMRQQKDAKLVSLADLFTAQSSFRAKKYTEARDIFERLSRDPDPQIQANALIGVIRCLAAEKKTDDLRRKCEEITRGANDNPALLACAYTALGDAVYVQAVERKEMKLYKEALLHYLRTVVRFPPTAGDSTEDYERSLYHAGICFAKLRDSLQKPESKKEYTDRALALFGELQRDFSASPWTALAQKEAQGIAPRK
jgi:tetratricopeptide (TPR) repeat protein